MLSFINLSHNRSFTHVNEQKTSDNINLMSVSPVIVANK